MVTSSSEGDIARVLPRYNPRGLIMLHVCIGSSFYYFFERWWRWLNEWQFLAINPQ